MGACRKTGSRGAGSFHLLKYLLSLALARMLLKMSQILTSLQWSRSLKGSLPVFDSLLVTRVVSLRPHLRKGATNPTKCFMEAC